MDLGNDVTTMIGHRLRMADGLAVFYRRGGVFGDQRADAVLICVVDEVGELLVDDDELLAEAAKTDAQLAQLPLDRTSTHGAGPGERLAPTGFDSPPTRPVRPSACCRCRRAGRRPRRSTRERCRPGRCGG